MASRIFCPFHKLNSSAACRMVLRRPHLTGGNFDYRKLQTVIAPAISSCYTLLPFSAAKTDGHNLISSVRNIS